MGPGFTPVLIQTGAPLGIYKMDKKSLKYLFQYLLISSLVVHESCLSIPGANKPNPLGNVLDAGFPGGSEARMKMAFDDKKGFNLKDISSAFISNNNSLEHVIVVLSTDSSSLLNTFHNPTNGGNAFIIIGTGPGTVPPTRIVNFTGLRANQNYYVAARAYSSYVNPTPGNTDTLSLNPDGNLSATSTKWQNGPVGILLPGDRIKFTNGGTNFDLEVVSVSGDTNAVVTPSHGAPALPGAPTTSIAPFTVLKNVTSINNLPGGNGGGVQDTLISTDPHEFIAVANDGTVSITNDATSPVDTTNNNQLDVPVQLQKSLGGIITGNIGVTAGSDGSATARGAARDAPTSGATTLATNGTNGTNARAGRDYPIAHAR